MGNRLPQSCGCCGDKTRPRASRERGIPRTARYPPAAVPSGKITYVGFLADGELVVLETIDDHYVGTAEIVDGLLVVRSGNVGRPVLLRPEQVRRVTPATEHPLVEFADLD